MCSLSSGSTLGESVLFGGQRKASVITQQTTQLFAISAENLKLLYGKYVKEMEGLFKSVNVGKCVGHWCVCVCVYGCAHLLNIGKVRTYTYVYLAHLH